MQCPVLLDLCCRMGGATTGYQHAGFFVIGVDVEKQKGYPGDVFIYDDMFNVLSREFLTEHSVVCIHASPPCQEANALNIGTNNTRANEHKQVIPALRARLRDLNVPYVLEQPTSSRKGTIRRDLTLCMDMFKGTMKPPWVQKHRSFEINGFTVPQPKHKKHKGFVRGWRHGVNRIGTCAPYVAGYGAGGGKATAEELQHAMQIDWMNDRFDLCEAIPPAYTKFIGDCFLKGPPSMGDPYDYTAKFSDQKTGASHFEEKAAAWCKTCFGTGRLTGDPSTVACFDCCKHEVTVNGDEIACRKCGRGMRHVSEGRYEAVPVLSPAQQSLESRQHDLIFPMMPKCSSCGSKTSKPFRKGPNNEFACADCFRSWRFMGSDAVQAYDNWKVVQDEQADTEWKVCEEKIRSDLGE